MQRLCAWVQHDVESRGSHLLILLDQLNIYTLDLGQAESALKQLPTLKGEASKWMDRMRHIRDRGVTLSSRNRQRFNRERQVWVLIPYNFVIFSAIKIYKMYVFRKKEKVY